MKLVKSTNDSVNGSNTMLRIFPTYRHWYKVVEGKTAQGDMIHLESYSNLVLAYL